MNTLTRMKIEDLPADIDSDRDFADLVKKELGYVGLKHHLTIQQKNHKVLSILRSVGVTPFDHASVNAYMDAKAKPRKLMWQIIAAVTIGIVATSCLASFLTGNPGGFILLVGLLIPAIFVVMMLPEGAPWDKRWNCYLLESEYLSTPVPEFALQTALDVGAALGKEKIKHSFMVHVLENSRDPFLSVEVDGCRYFLEVWNEPSFKAKREPETA